MRVTTQGVKKNIDPTMMSGVEDRMRGDDKVVEVSSQLVDKSGKEDEIPQKVTPVPKPPPPFPQIMVEKTEDCKYANFITMLK